jgi:hypothetical protein
MKDRTSVKPSSSESGQILIILVLAIVGLLGIAALAIDGGMLFANRRFDQNSSDASALSGGAAAANYLETNGIYWSSFNCSHTGVLAAMTAAQNAAITRAATRNFSLDTDLSDQHGVQVICDPNNKHLDIRVMITSQTDTSFAHLITNQPLQTTVEAIVRIRPRQPLVLGNAIVALDPDGCQGHQDGAIMFGNSDVNVTGGGIFSNGCLRENGGPDVNVTGGGISYVNDLAGDPNAFNPPAQQVPDPLPPESYAVPPPDCADPAAHNVTKAQLAALDPLPPGLYCVSGGIPDTLHGTDVTIYVLSGGVDQHGNDLWQLDAPPRDPDPSPALPGVLIMFAPGNISSLTFNGNSSTAITGLILAPQSYIKLNGTGNTNGYHCQVIGWDVEIGGTADTYVTFDESEQYLKPPALDLLR